jgi:gamma-glutamyltranspeptidase/glutathione hydrolase
MFEYFSKDYPFPSKRNMVYAKNGMVATSQPLASQAGLDILKKGGNAVDAAIAVAACLTVVEPTSNGIGGDAFAIVWMKGQIYGLNASGVSPKGISIEALNDLGIKEIPRFGFIPVTVPGIPSAWASLSKRFGKLSLLECLTPAIEYAKNGYPLSPTLAFHWNNAFQIYSKHLKGNEFDSWFDTFTINHKAPKEGEVWSSLDHANTLELIGKTNADAFYKGILSDKIDAYSKQYHGFIRKSDLEDYKPLWVSPIKVSYKGFDVWEIPPNGQGLVALEALKIVEGFELLAKSPTEIMHLQIESLKLAFSDGNAYICDPSNQTITPSDLLNLNYIEHRRKLIKNRASLFSAGKPNSSGTVYLATADKDGNMVSYIQSNYMGFGSGLVVPGTGIALQNRGHNFSLDKNHLNHLSPGVRPYHTIIPGFLTKGHEAIGPFGVMGGFMQPQGHMQVVMNVIDYKYNPQSAIDAPRWQWLVENKVALEKSMPKAIVAGLKKLGHDIVVLEDSSSFGRGEIIFRDLNSGVLAGGCEPRCDASISGW